MPKLQRSGIQRTALARLCFAILLLAGGGYFAASSQAAEPIKPADFAELHKLIQPTEAESAWLSIGWGTDLWQAREKAAAEGKPILLWEMDGHPLGCT
jgi:hypothetical protein